MWETISMNGHRTETSSDKEINAKIHHPSDLKTILMQKVLVIVVSGWFFLKKKSISDFIYSDLLILSANACESLL